MKKRYLEVTYRKGVPLAAYYYLSREPGEKADVTREEAPGLLVDFSRDGKPIGIEIVLPRRITVEQINAVLSKLGLDAMEPLDLVPLKAA